MDSVTQSMVPIPPLPPTCSAWSFIGRAVQQLFKAGSGEIIAFGLGLQVIVAAGEGMFTW